MNTHSLALTNNVRIFSAYDVTDFGANASECSIRVFESAVPDPATGLPTLAITTDGTTPRFTRTQIRQLVDRLSDWLYRTATV